MLQGIIHTRRIPATLCDHTNAGPSAPMYLRWLNREPKFGPAREQRLQRANPFDACELMAEAEMSSCPEGQMPVRPSLEIHPLGALVCFLVQIGGDDHRHDPVALLKADAVQIDILAHVARP